VGLGNPGPEYARTRHNAGWRLLDHLVEQWEMAPLKRAGGARQGTTRRHGHDCRLIKPLMYMNRSGAILAPLRALPAFEPSRDLLVLVDDVALPLGRFRLRGQGSAGGHNGLKSIEGALLRQDYGRLRIGIGPVPDEMDDLADFVLSPFLPDEDDILEDLLDPMADAVDLWLARGIADAMNTFNR